MIIFLGNGSSLSLYSEFIESVKDTKPDIVVSCQYPFKLPESILKNNICVNIHYGILPQFAGCNPVFWQIMKSDQAGTTLHYMDEGFDSGDIVDIYRFPTYGKTADEVYNECARGGLELLKIYFNSILKGTAPREKQDLKFRRYYNKTDVDFNKFKKIYTKGMAGNMVNEKQVRAAYFKGKQFPIVEVEGVEYELRKVGEK
jgi:methionyl-tRNA formyltransferase